MRLIDADAFEEFVKEKCSYCTSFIDEEKVLSWIDKAPTIDPNELDLDIDYSIEYDKRPDGISNAKVTITRIKPRNVAKVADIINVLPSADRPKGEWFNDGLDTFSMSTAYFCSRCGYSTRYNKNPKITTNYCPCCGAEMKGEK